MAIASLVLGVIAIVDAIFKFCRWICLGCSLLGFIFGIIAMIKSNKKVLAIIAYSISLVGLVIAIIWNVNVMNNKKIKNAQDEITTEDISEDTDEETNDDDKVCFSCTY